MAGDSRGGRIVPPAGGWRTGARLRVLGVTRSLSGRLWRQRAADRRPPPAATSGLTACPSCWPAPWPSRGITGEAGADFLNPTLKALFPDPSCFADMDKAAAEILVDAPGGRTPGGRVRRL